MWYSHDGCLVKAVSDYIDCASATTTRSQEKYLSMP